MDKRPTMNSWDEWIKEGMIQNNPLWKQISDTKKELENKELWEEMRQATKNNVTLQHEFERLKVIYFLIKEESEGGADAG